MVSKRDMAAVEEEDVRKRKREEKSDAQLAADLEQPQSKRPKPNDLNSSSSVGKIVGRVSGPKYFPDHVEVLDENEDLDADGRYLRARERSFAGLDEQAGEHVWTDAFWFAQMADIQVRTNMCRIRKPSASCL